MNMNISIVKPMVEKKSWIKYLHLDSGSLTKLHKFAKWKDSWGFQQQQQKSPCLKWMYGHPSIDYRVASLFTRYLNAIGIIPESLNLIGKF